MKYQQPLDYEVYPEKRKPHFCGFSTKELIKLILGLSIVALVLTALFYASPSFAQHYTEHYLAQGFTPEQLSQMEEQAKAEWNAENGNLQPNLTVEQARYLIGQVSKETK